MFKRIKEKLTSGSKEDLEDVIMPLEEELANPELSQKEIYQRIALKNAFKGKHQCKLCPEKVLETDLDLHDHLSSKSHKVRLNQYYSMHKGKLLKLISKAKHRAMRKYVFNTRKLQKVANFGIHYKLMKQITV